MAGSGRDRHHGGERARALHCPRHAPRPSPRIGGLRTRGKSPTTRSAGARLSRLRNLVVSGASGVPAGWQSLRRTAAFFPARGLGVELRPPVLPALHAGGGAAMARAAGRDDATAGQDDRRLGSRPVAPRDLLPPGAGAGVPSALQTTAGVGGIGGSAVTTFIPVLLYHSVNDRPPAGERRWTVSPREFASQLDTVAASGRTSMTVSAIAEGLRGERSLPPRPV